MPQDIQAEEYLLGTVIVDNRNITTVLEMLTPDAFFKDENRIIFEAIVELTSNRVGVDMLTVTSLLRKNGKLQTVGGALAISKLTDNVGSTANIHSYCAVIKEKYLLRQMISLGENLYTNGLKVGIEVKDLLTIAESSLTKITNKVIPSAFITSAQLYDEALQRNDLILKLKSENKIIGLTTGIKKLDKKTSGWQKGNLVIIAGRTSMGKTSFALHAMLAAALSEERHPVAFFSLEMPNNELYSRILSQMSNVPLSNILYNGMDELELKRVLANADKLKSAPIYFEDKAELTLFEFQNKCRKLKREKGISMVIVDLLQKIKNPMKGANRATEVESVSRGLKEIAKELEIPVIALAQLSRETEKRGAASMPMLSDLRESGGIEQDADIVMFIYRPEYYGIHQYEDGSSTAGIAELIIQKGRNIGLGQTKVAFDKEYVRFSDLEENYNFNHPTPF